MEFKEYQERMIKTKVYQASFQIIYPALKIAGEAGEVSEKIGKVLRDKEGEIDENDKQEIKKELGDVLWYINAMATDLGIDLEDVARTNVDKLESRQKRDKLHGSGDNR